MMDNEMNGATTDALRDAGDAAAAKFGDMGRSAANAVDGRRKAAADGLATAAEKLHRTADNLPGVERISDLTHGAADRIGGAADFLRDHDTKAMVDGVQQFVRKHPGKSLAVAAVVGFMAARALRSE